MRQLRAVVWVSLFSGCMVVPAPPPASGPPPPAWQPPPGPPAAVGGIEIVNATYGGNCGAPRGNVIGHLAQMCGGQARCSYRIDYKVIGDPAVGCGKDYVAEWRCPGAPQVYRATAAPEAGYGAVIELGCAGATAAPPPPVAYQPPPAPPPPAPPPAAPPPPVFAPSLGRPHPHHHSIHVVAGSYGQNCRAAHGNTTPHLQQMCEGRPSCAYRVDYKVIGDPAYGCMKDYVAEWSCGADPTMFRSAAGPEAGYGSIVNLTCEGGAAVAAPPPAPPPPPPPPPPPRGHGPIVVRSGSYGPSCGTPRGNVTAHLSQSCNGRFECSYRVDYKVIGDPAYGCRKDYVAEWTCGDHPEVHRASAPPEAGFGAVVELRCR